MTALILVVDDVPANVKLLEAKLTNEYYDVVTAKDGFEAIKKAQEHKPDLILLDVMMPGMDGFETCRRLKEDISVSHIPVVMVTALSEPSDRVNGLEAGADDFITKPIKDTALLARVRSLIRIKVLIDELRLRDQSVSQIGGAPINSFTSDVSGSSLLLIDDDVVQSKRIIDKLAQSYKVDHLADPKAAMQTVKTGSWDLIIVSTQLSDMDGLRLASHFRSMDAMRHVPIVMLVDEDDQEKMLKGLELGINDYLLIPVDYNEMIARVKTQIRRKKYQEALKSSYQESVSMAVTDGLTKLYNRRYLDTHLQNLARQSLENQKPMSLVIMDMDHFKSVNDTYGHDVGDEVLIQLAQIITKSIRSADLAARFGGEEFVVLMPETDAQSAHDVAERIRRSVENTPFQISHQAGVLNKTISIGVARLNLKGDTPEAMLKRADTALYEAKHGGRNRVMPSLEHLLADMPSGVGLQPLPPMQSASAPPPPAPVQLAPMQPLQPMNAPPAPEAQPAFTPPPPPTFQPLQPLNQPPSPPPAAPVDYTLAQHTVAINKPLTQPAVSYDLVGVKKQQVAAGGGKIDSPIDDEPPGTF